MRLSRRQFDLALVIGLVVGGILLYPSARVWYHLALLRSPNIDQAMESQAILADLAPRTYPALLRTAKSSPNGEARRLALGALVTISTGTVPGFSDPEVLSLTLRIASNDWDQELQSLAIQRLGFAKHPEAHAPLARLLRHPDPTIRDDAIRALGSYNNVEDVALVAALLRDSHPEVVQRAALTLSRLTGDPLVLPRGNGEEEAETRHQVIEAWFAARDLQLTSEPVNALPPSAGPLAPAFALPNLDEQIVRLADYRGRPVILNFWATWCVPCRKEIPELNALVASLGDTVSVLGISVEADNTGPAERALEAQGAIELDEGAGHSHGHDDHPPEIAAKIREYQRRVINAVVADLNMQYPVLMADDDTLAAYGVTSAPVTVILRPDGRIHRRLIGERPHEYFAHLVAEAAAPVQAP